MDEYERFQEALRGELQRRGVRIRKAPKQDNRLRNPNGSYAPRAINLLIKAVAEGHKNGQDIGSSTG